MTERDDKNLTPPPADDGVDTARRTRLSYDDPGADAVVREYEQRYRPDRLDRDNDPDPQPKMKRGAKTKSAPRSYSTMRLTDDERLWAGIAHASAWLTLLGGFFSAGAIVLVTIFIPLVIYFVYRKRSNFVAFHALQAFVLQLVGTLGAILLLTVGGVVWLLGLIVAFLSVMVLVGFVLVPLWSLIGVALVGITALLPLVMAFYGTLAAIETFNGRDYRYPRIAEWVDRQVSNSYMHIV